MVGRAEGERLVKHAFDLIFRPWHIDHLTAWLLNHPRLVLAFLLVAVTLLVLDLFALAWFLGKAGL
jgi:hypothetical protein